MFSEEEIKAIYNDKVKLPQSYFDEHNVLPPCPVKAFNYNWANYDFPRNWCVLDFIEWTKKHNIEIDHLGYTCDSDIELEFIHPSKKTLVSYPEYDLHTIASTTEFKNEFDFFLFNQTIEHLYNPFEAMKQVYEIVKPGGYVFTSVPTINIPHMTPVHFNGYTPMGLAMLFKTANFEIIEIGQWGNFDYIQKLFGSHSWPGFNRLINSNGYIPNEERNACQCWILAKKM
jgi:SAM-dependent methyltransferase